MRLLLSCLLFGYCLGAAGQAAPAGSNWQRVQQLPQGTKVHVAADIRSRVCTVDAVTETALTCSKGRLIGGAHYRFERTAVKSVKLTRYAVSTWAGVGVGAGVGGLIGAAAIRGGTLIDFSGEARAIVAVGGGIAGGLVGGPTDFLRGPTIYRRP